MADTDVLSRAVAFLRETVLVDTAVGDNVEPFARDFLSAIGVHAGEPVPVHQDGEPSVHDLAAEWVAAARSTHPAWQQLVALLAARKAHGLAKYGTTLQIGGPRDPARDVLDELLDGVAYAQQGLERAERAEPPAGAGDPMSGAWWRARRRALADEALQVIAGMARAVEPA